VAPQVNWSKLLNELNKIADVERLKTEVRRIGQEIRKFDINAHLSPTARERLKTVEGKYHEITKTLSRTQRQVDREFNRVLRNLKTQKNKAEKGLEVVKAAARTQKRRLEKASADIRERVLKAANGRVKRKTTRKKSAKSHTTA
jgi:hypothetical protein